MVLNTASAVINFYSRLEDQATKMISKKSEKLTLPRPDG